MVGFQTGGSDVDLRPLKQSLGAMDLKSLQTSRMPNMGRPLVERHAPKNGVGWLINSREKMVCSF